MELTAFLQPIFEQRGFTFVPIEDGGTYYRDDELAKKGFTVNWPGRVTPDGVIRTDCKEKEKKDWARLVDNMIIDAIVGWKK